MLMHEPTQTVNSFWGQSQHAPATKWRSLGVTISREAGEVRARDLALLTALAALVTVGLAPSASPAPTSTTTAAASRLPPLSPAFIKEVNSLDSWTIVLATPQEAATATVPEMAAVATALHKDVTAARASAASLVVLTDAQHPRGRLVWAVDTTPPNVAPAFQVDFVDAVTGKWLESVSGSTGVERPGTALAAVSCPEASWCLAVGQQDILPGGGLGGNFSRPLAVIVSGQATAVHSFGSTDQSGDWDAVSCGSARSCVVVGNDSYALRYNGAKWARVPLAGVRGGAEAKGQPMGLPSLTSISCPAEEFCMAVGRYSASQALGASEWTLAEQLRDGTWTVAPGITGLSQAWLDSISCSSARLCLTVGEYSSPALVEVFRDGHWSPAPGPDLDLQAVSCPTGLSCTAVGARAVGTRVADTAVESFDGARWHLVASPNPDASNNSFDGVSCPSPNWCAAVGSDGPGGLRPLAEEWDGAGWSLTSRPVAPSRFGSRFSSVSCAAPGSCVAVGAYTLPSGVVHSLVERLANGSWQVLQSP